MVSVGHRLAKNFKKLGFEHTGENISPRPFSSKLVRGKNLVLNNKGNLKVKSISNDAIAKIKSLPELDKGRKVLAIVIVKRIKSNPSISFEDLTAFLAGEARKKGLIVARDSRGGKYPSEKPVDLGTIKKLIELLKSKNIILVSK
ncbi:MAG: hypothetical protein WC915_00595 [archaeon]|jgi:hypothetical protein